jgi:hypothetical protein
MNSTGAPEKVNLPDTEVEWYDFGGGHSIAPTTIMDGERLQGLTGEGPNMAALCCVRRGLLYFKTIEGTFTTEDLPSMFKEYAPAFTAEVKVMTQETQ